jgi:molybdenum cofactor cytidylyltransferase
MHAIVLTAGKSERMGKPKALLSFRGKTFLEHILDVIARSSIESTVVVLGHHRDVIEKNTTLHHSVFNPDYAQGMITSFQAGIRALPPNSGAVLFLVDHPVVDVATIELLIRHHRPGTIVLPTYHGQRGHPVLFSAEVLQEVLALSPSRGANVVVRKDPARVVEVAVNAPGILMDIDTPEQFEALKKNAGG